MSSTLTSTVASLRARERDPAQSDDERPLPLGHRRGLLLRRSRGRRARRARPGEMVGRSRHYAMAAAWSLVWSLGCGNPSTRALGGEAGARKGSRVLVEARVRRRRRLPKVAATPARAAP